MTTTKLLIAMVVFVAVVVGGMIYYRYKMVSQNFNLPPLIGNQEVVSTVDGRLSTVEDALALLINRVNTGTGKVETTITTSSGSLDARVQSLENTVANLQVQINSLKSSSPGEVTTTVNRSPAYIPLGTGGSVNSRDWVTVAGYEVTIDSADYSGYTNAYLEVTMRMSEPKSTKAFARLYNSTNDSAVSGEATTTATIYTLATTSSFQLSPGKKTYKLQVKSTDTGEIFIQDARIKITF